MNILIAEDNMFAANQYETILEKKGHQVTLTSNGEECLKTYENNCEKMNAINPDRLPFDVVVLDNNMPKKNGIQVAKEILKLNSKQRIIFASAYDIDVLKTVSDDIKSNLEILQKPFTLIKMVERIENHIHR